MTLIIDCHGHYTTAPAAHDDWRAEQRTAWKAGAAALSYPAISDDEICETLEPTRSACCANEGRT